MTDTFSYVKTENHKCPKKCLAVIIRHVSASLSASPCSEHRGYSLAGLHGQVKCLAGDWGSAVDSPMTKGNTDQAAGVGRVGIVPWQSPVPYVCPTAQARGPQWALYPEITSFSRVWGLDLYQIPEKAGDALDHQHEKPRVLKVK